ncbi:MAG TPA: hypothetical protein VMM13_01990, partial [Euzebya sp.]|nr:hypothetical protein [Euzebya sp.]
MSSAVLAAEVNGLGDAIAQACGDDPNAVCRLVLEATGLRSLATFAGSAAPVVLKILLILVVAAILARVAKRVLRRIVVRASDESRDALLALRRRASTERDPTTELTRAERERAAQRSNTIAGVVGSVVAFAIWTFAIASALSSLGV